MASCHFCGAGIAADTAIYRNSECPQCTKPLKICLNCDFYEKGAQWDCRETIGEPVREKERANFCDYFRLRAVNGAGGPGGGPAGTGKAAFDSLFDS